MNKPLFKRGIGLLLALVLTLGAAPVSANAFTLVQLKDTDVTLDETVFQYTGEQIKPNVTVRVDGQLLTLDRDYTLEYADNIEIGTGKVIVTGNAAASTKVGYTGTVEVPFEISENPPAFTLIELKGTDVWMDSTEFAYTGSPIEPAVTVTVEGKTLVKDRDYRVSYKNNVQPGTATLTVMGKGTASETVGYTGTVEMNFTITKPAPYVLKGTDVTIEGTKFTYTGSYIEPKVTVRVNGEVLTAGEHYTLRYYNNLGAGTATAAVSGIESAGYTGQVNISFTIEKDQQGTEPTEPKPTEPKPTEPETTEPKPTEPKPTEPEATEPKPTEPEETKPELVKYTITKGNKATWYLESGKALSFTTDGAKADITGIRIDGKTLQEKHYDLSGKDSGVVTLKNSFLKLLSADKHTITVLFEDGQADGTFRVAKGLDTSNPETSDTFALGLWITVMGVSAASVAALFLLRRKIF